MFDLEPKLKINESYCRRKYRSQPCPVCTCPIGDMPGTPDAICKNCGFKDPCCE